MAKTAGGSDPFVIAVVMDEGHTRFFRRAGEEKIGWRNTAMIAAGRQCQLGSSGPCPELGGHRDRLEGRESISDPAGARLIGGEASQLEDDQIADKDHPCFDGGVEPGRELGKAPTPDPGPSPRIEKSRSI